MYLFLYFYFAVFNLFYFFNWPGFHPCNFYVNFRVGLLYIKYAGRKHQDANTFSTKLIKYVHPHFRWSNVHLFIYFCKNKCEKHIYKFLDARQKSHVTASTGHVTDDWHEDQGQVKGHLFDLYFIMYNYNFHLHFCLH